MPKRRARSSDSLDDIPAPKLPKKVPNRAKHGRASAKPVAHRKMTSISSNWKALSESLGTKQTQSSGSSVGRDRRKGRGGGTKNKSEKESSSNQKRKQEVSVDDDIPREFVNVERSTKPPVNKGSLATGSDKSAGKCVGLDCEMVGTGPDGSYSMLARVCIVNHHGNVLLDTFVARMDRVTDYRTAISGVTHRDLRGAPEFSVVQKQVSELLDGRILVGHSVQNDLKALLLSHPKRDTRDTLKYSPFKKIAKTRYPSLKKLALEILGVEIQNRAHSPVEDARAAMKLYQMHKKEWEASVKARLTKREIQERKRERKRREDDARRGIERGATRTQMPSSLEKPFTIMLHTER